MTNLEIEDVLSSIRRLVSEDSRPGPRIQRERTTADGRLVLTPALRIVSSRPEPLPPLLLRPEDLAVSHREAAAAVEAALPPRSEAWEAEVEAPQSNARWADGWPASPQAATAAAPPAAASGERPVTEAARPEDDDYDLFGPIDEEALRDMIRDILHGELQGALGERITRNVRKLVRAEIARAFATRDAQGRDTLARHTF